MLETRRREEDMVRKAALVLVVATQVCFCLGQEKDFTAVRARVDFSKNLRVWDGFGVNYVETAQTPDYSRDPQEYGGFSLLTEAERQQILDMIFGDDGLKPGVVKMFLDPYHQSEAGGPYDHETTTKWMRYFVQGGLERTRGRGENLQILTTLYGPPAYVTKQKFVRGRDLDPEKKLDCAQYVVEWARYLKENGFPIRYVSLHNEGEDWQRWPPKGESANWENGHDYNLFWPPEQVVDFVKILRTLLDQAGLKEVGVTPGECTNWYRFSAWGYADAIAEDEGALASLGLITSHGFYSGTYGRWFGEHRSVGTDTLRAKRPELHAWVTSTSWSSMDANSIKEMHGNIYTAKVNSITPWACIQRPEKWVGGDPNPGTAFRVHEDGTYEIMQGYYVYKQVCRAGQPGMGVAWTSAMDSEVALIAFSSNGTRNTDAFVVTNLGKQAKSIVVHISGSAYRSFDVFRTTDGGERYKAIGSHSLRGDNITYQAPARSVTTFQGK
jgi:O-glycosyl hydrolase